jgi:steroid delta-isomerase-like uncharacterized protein
MKHAYKLLPICLVVLGLVCPGCAPSSTARLEENKAIVRRVIEEVDKGNWAIFDELLARDYVYHMPRGPKPLTREEYEELMRAIRAAFPDQRVTIEDMIAEGDKVVTRYTSSGTHKGDFMGIPATGNKVVATGIVISRIADGKIAEDWEEFDGVGFMQQLGIIPPMGEPGEK